MQGEQPETDREQRLKPRSRRCRDGIQGSLHRLIPVASQLPLHVPGISRADKSYDEHQHGEFNDDNWGTKVPSRFKFRAALHRGTTELHASKHTLIYVPTSRARVASPCPSRQRVPVENWLQNVNRIIASRSRWANVVVRTCGLRSNAGLEC